MVALRFDSQDQHSLFCQLILTPTFQAIIESEEKQLTLNEIYNYFMKTFAYFRYKYLKKIAFNKKNNFNSQNIKDIFLTQSFQEKMLLPGKTLYVIIYRFISVLFELKMSKELFGRSMKSSIKNDDLKNCQGETS